MFMHENKRREEISNKTPLQHQQQNTKIPRCKNTKDEYSTRRKRDTQHVNIKHKRLHINRRDQWATGADFGRPFVTQVANGVVILDYVRTTLSLLQLPRGLEERNDNLHHLTSFKNQRLYIVMTDAISVTRYVTYDNFVIEDESTDYTIRIGAFSGTDVDKFRAGPNWNVDGMKFSTKDVDNDLRSGASCAVQFTGAWWYNDCMTSNLNGQYYTTCSSLPAHDKNCNYWSGTGPMRMTKMMVKRM
ncbi:hypothetical protein FSP39_022305 [Pinctada imbricata]|uniref:Fibrinogen C-terminal domain-containing protein n=1 Tax=Pinctada imbricata TaxID=66713 RepID=A0AA88YSB9_PINIB|nr:hypothetical protein FSP39_022305 [Pinctada imbricata]